MTIDRSMSNSQCIVFVWIPALLKHRPLRRLAALPDITRVFSLNLAAPAIPGPRMQPIASPTTLTSAIHPEGRTPTTAIATRH